MSLENIINKGMEPGGFELTPSLEMGDFIALLSYKPTDTVGDIDRTPQEALARSRTISRNIPITTISIF